MKHGYSKNRAVPVLDTFLVLVLLGYFCQAYLKFSKKKKKKFSFIFFFFFEYVTKIDKSSESDGNINFR
jgi:hypothetical protein